MSFICPKSLSIRLGLALRNKIKYQNVKLFLKKTVHDLRLQVTEKENYYNEPYNSYII